MILKAKHNFIIYPFVKWYAVWKIKKKFSPIKVFGEYKEKNLPILLISNHLSFWDGFWALYLNKEKFKRKFHYMILEEQLRKYWYLNYSGGFSVNKKAKTIIETLNYTAELLGDNKNLVLLFPQGKIQSMHHHFFQYEKGIEHILKKSNNKIQIIFLANFVDFFSNPKMGIYMYIKEYGEINYKSDYLQNHYNDFFKQCIEKQKQIIG